MCLLSAPSHLLGAPEQHHPSDGCDRGFCCESGDPFSWLACEAPPTLAPLPALPAPLELATLVCPSVTGTKIVSF